MERTARIHEACTYCTHIRLENIRSETEYTVSCVFLFCTVTEWNSRTQPPSSSKGGKPVPFVVGESVLSL